VSQFDGATPPFPAKSFDVVMFNQQRPASRRDCYFSRGDEGLPVGETCIASYFYTRLFMYMHMLYMDMDM